MPLQIVPIDALAAAKGFPIQLQSTVRRDAKQMLQEGTFSGIVRFQLAKRGDPISDLVSYGDEGLGIALPQTDGRQPDTPTGCRRCGWPGATSCT